MNERIRELLVKARKSTKEGKWNAPTAVWAEKFAELIVQECADIALREEHDPYECIKKHFGVK